MAKKSNNFDIDREYTLANRAKLSNNKNLIYWYRELFRRALGVGYSDSSERTEKKVLEIGSGTSPLASLSPDVITSDILPLDYLDYVLDCHELDRFDQIPDGTLDIITLTNVLHHLKEPLRFLHNASSKLKTGGRIIMTEPYLSVLSRPIFKYLHHEAFDADVEVPVLEEVTGPLSSANTALPYLIFCSKKGKKWRDSLCAYSDIRFFYYTSSSYFITGGISGCFKVPHFIYRFIFMLDDALTKILPRIFCSFFTITLTKKGELDLE